MPRARKTATNPSALLLAAAAPWVLGCEVLAGLEDHALATAAPAATVCTGASFGPPETVATSTDGEIRAFGVGDGVVFWATGPQYAATIWRRDTTQGGATAQALADGQSDPNSFLAGGGSWMFWGLAAAEKASGAVVRAPLRDGAEVQTLGSLDKAPVHASALAEPYLFWIAGDSIFRMRTDGTGPWSYQWGASMMAYLAARGARVYCYSPLYGSLQAFEHGVNFEAVEPTVVDVATDDLLALTADADVAYWTTADGRLMRGGVDQAPEVVTPIGLNAADIAVDDVAVYWISKQDGTVMAACKDGASAPVVIASGQDGLRELAIDVTGLYWSHGDVMARAPRL